MGARIGTRISNANRDSERERQIGIGIMLAAVAVGRGGGKYHDPNERYGLHHRCEGSQEYGRSADEWWR